MPAKLVLRGLRMDSAKRYLFLEQYPATISLKSIAAALSEKQFAFLQILRYPFRMAQSHNTIGLMHADLENRRSPRPWRMTG